VCARGSLTYNNPERNGMLDAIRELDMVLMAYSPLQSGLLTGASRGWCWVRGVRRIRFERKWDKFSVEGSRGLTSIGC